MKTDRIQFRISFTFFAAAAFFLSGEMYYNYICAVGFSLLHEAGHLLAMTAFGTKPEKITLGIMGIRIDKTQLSLSYSRECITALCGPFVNLLFLITFSYDMNSLPFVINTGLFLINMLPVKTLDGGRFIYHFIALKWDENTASKILNILEIATVLILIAVLIISVISGFVNTSFVLFAVLLVIIIVSELLIAPAKSTHG